MKFITLIIYIILYLFNIIKIINSNETIIFAFEMCRHGARAPYLGVENGLDKYKEYWPIVEESTSTGKRQLYLLGVKARLRYNNLLKEKYDPNEILIKSTDSNRTIEAISSFLQGLYPNGTGEILNDNISNKKNIIYPPNTKYYDYFDDIINEYDMNNSALPNKINIVPVHVMNKNEKNFNLYDVSLCPYRKYENAKKFSNPKLAKLALKSVNETGNLFLELEPTEDINFLNDYWTFYKYADTFYCDDTDKRRFDFLNNKYGKDMVDKLRNISKEYLDLCYFDINFDEEDTDIGLLSSSHTMNLVLDWISEAKQNYLKSNNYLKYVVYSAHDISVGALDAFMKAIFKNDIYECDFGCSRIIELYLKNEEFYIRYLLTNESIIINEKYDDFVRRVKEKIWSDEDIRNYCEENKDNKDNNKNNTSYNLMIFLIILNAILLIFLVAFYRNKKNLN